MSGFDELIERLLYDVALSGEQGLSADQFQKLVRTFYDEKNSSLKSSGNGTSNDLLFSDAPPAGTPTLDDDFLGTVLSWLSGHSDIKLTEVKGETGGGQEENQESTSPFRAKLLGKRITTSETRVWHAITGHGVDYKRVPQKEFEILCVIAAHGAAGILQPYVTKLTGQDKRSVPKRTDMLAEKGYITKETVIGTGQKTSSLRLKRYAADHNLAPQAQPGSTLASRHVIYYNSWYDATIKLLKENGNMVTMQDLRLHLGIPLRSWERRILVRCICRLVDSGCIRRLTATLQGRDGNPLTVIGRSQQVRRAKAIQLLREPTAFDRLKWKESDPKGKRNHGVNSSEDEREEVVVDRNADQADTLRDSDEEGEIIDIDDGQDGISSTEQRIPPQWTHEIPLTNQVYNVVERAGQEGINSKDLHASLTGPLWRRPLDEIAARISDVSHHSQPPHLRHLAIVRDTVVHNKLAVFQYRTLENFEKAVKEGLPVPNSLAKSTASGRKNASLARSQLDEWGFPVIQPKELAGRDGRATLAEGRKGLPVPRLQRLASEDSINAPKSTSLEVGMEAGAHVRMKSSRKSAVSTRATRTKRKRAGEDITPVFSASIGANVAEKRSGPISKRRRTVGTDYADLGSDVEASANDIAPPVTAPIDEERGDNPSTSANAPQDSSVASRAGASQTLDYTITGRVTKSPVFSAAEQLKALRSRRGRRSKETWARIAELTKIVEGETGNAQEGAASQSARSSPPLMLTTVPTRKSLLVKLPIGKNTSMLEKHGSTKGAPAIVLSTSNNASHVPVPVQVALNDNATYAAPSEALAVEQIHFEGTTALPPAQPVEQSEHDFQSSEKEIAPPQVIETPLADKHNATNGATSSDPLVSPPQGYVDIAYVDSHPHETFHHCGGDRWARGPPPLGNLGRIGVRGPGLEQLKTQSGKAKTSFRRLSAGPKNPTKIAKTGESRTTSVRNSLRKSLSGSGASSRGSMIVKLHLPKHFLETLQSASRISAPTSLKLATFMGDAALPTPSEDPSTLVTTDKTHDSLDMTGAELRSHSPPNTAKPVTLPQNLTISPIRDIGEDGSLQFPRQTNLTHIDVPTCTASQIREPDCLQQECSSSGAPDENTPTRPAGGATETLIDVANPQANALVDIIESTNATKGLTITRTNDLGRHSDGNYAVEPTIKDLATDISVEVENHEPIMDRGAELDGSPGEGTNLPDTSPAISAKRLGNSGKRTPRSVLAQYQKIILDAIRSCDGLFPGNNELWFVIATAWKRLHGEVPEKSTIESVVKNMVQSKKLRKLTFQFKKNGVVIQQCILTEPNIDSFSGAVKQMQKRIVAEYPGRYLPLEVEIEDGMRLTAKKSQTEKGPVTTNMRSLDSDPSNVTATVRQTAQSAALADEEAKRQGFVDAQALHAHLDEQAQQKRKEHSKARSQRILKAKPPKPPKPPKPRKSSVAKPGRITVASGTDTCDDDDEEEASPEQLALQNEFQLNNYEHDPATAMIAEEWSSMFETMLRLDVKLSFFHRPDLSRRKVHAYPRTQDFQHLQSEQNFHPATGTFGTTIKRNAQRASNLRATATDEAGLQHSYSTEPLLSSIAGKRRIPRLASLSVHMARGQQPNSQNADSPAPALSSTAPPRRKYKSRIKNVEVPDAGHVRFDPEFVPGTAKIQYSKTQEISARDRKSPAAFKDGDRLVTAYGLIAALCGGINQDRISWNLIAHALSFRYDGEFLRRRWDNLKKTRMGDVEKLRDAIREPFLEAYEKDEVPRVDYSNLSKTDWPALFTWVEAKIRLAKPEGDSAVPDLAESREDLDFAVKDPASIFELHRDEYFTTGTDQNRKHLAVRYHHGTSAVASSTPREGLRDSSILLKSWIRAAAVTKEYNYNVQACEKKLTASFRPAVIAKEVNGMVASHIIAQEKKGRVLPGRNYHIHAEVLSQFRRWPAKPEEHQYLRIVAQAYTTINTYFQAHDELTLIPAASDPEYLVLTNMVAQGFLRPKVVLPERKDDYGAPYPKLSPWGYGTGYEMKKVEMAHLKFPIVYTKTPAYIARHTLQAGVPIPMRPPAPDAAAAAAEGGEDGRIPFWVDIFGNLIDDIWDMCLRSLMHLLVFRPGSTAMAMEVAHRRKFWAWEIELALRWMEDVGIASHRNGGWQANKWWFCAFLPEICTWHAPR